MDAVRHDLAEQDTRAGSASPPEFAVRAETPSVPRQADPSPPGARLPGTTTTAPGTVPGTTTPGATPTTTPGTAPGRGAGPSSPPRLPGPLRRLRLRTRRWVIRRLAPGFGAAAGLKVANVPFPAEVVVYFPDDPQRSYQLVQWLPVLERLDQEHKVLIVLRQASALKAIHGLTSLPIVNVRRFRDLLGLYEANGYKVILYPNNGVLNFQSLACTTALHVHINHGESDKSCMVSHQTRAYDRVFVAGEAAIARHRSSLMEVDETRLVAVGRPQLDLTLTPELAPSSGRTVIYAPTWEGENEGNNYTSVDVYGPTIVRALLSLPDVRVVYKPHPRIPTSTCTPVAEAHREIVDLIEWAGAAVPSAGHRAVLDGNVLAMVDACDAMITDVSSVGLDFLYLRTDRPILLTDRWNDRDRLLETAPVAGCADVIDEESLSRTAALVAECLDHDRRREDRAAVRRLYFGDLTPGESTRRFLSAVEELIEVRDRAMATLAVRSVTAVG